MSQMDKNKHEYLRIREAADQLGVTPSTLRRHIQDGELAALRLGANGNLRIRRTDLQTFLQKVEPRP